MTSTLDAMVTAALASENAQGWDPTANSGAGGVRVNWYLDQAGSQNTGHDEGEDLRAFEALLEWKHHHATNTRFDADIARLRAVCHSIFSNGYGKSWSWRSMQRLAVLDSATFWDTALRRTLDSWMAAIDPAVGVAHGPVTAGTGGATTEWPDAYRVDAALQIGCGLISAGRNFGDDAMTAAGERMLTVVRAQGFVTGHGLYARIVATPATAPTIVDWQAKSGEQGQSAWLLAVAGQPDGLALLNALKASPLHDQTNGGFYFKLLLDTGVLVTAEKEQGRCMAIARAAALLGDTVLRDEMLATSVKADRTGTYGTPLVSGWPYRTTPEFGIFDSELWVTSEAINLNALACLTVGV